MDKNEIERKEFISRVSMYDEAVELFFGKEKDVKVTVGICHNGENFGFDLVHIKGMICRYFESIDKELTGMRNHIHYSKKTVKVKPRKVNKK